MGKTLLFKVIVKFLFFYCDHRWYELCSWKNICCTVISKICLNHRLWNSITIIFLSNYFSNIFLFFCIPTNSRACIKYVYVLEIFVEILQHFLQQVWIIQNFKRMYSLSKFFSKNVFTNDIIDDKFSHLIFLFYMIIFIWSIVHYHYISMQDPELKRGDLFGICS